MGTTLRPGHAGVRPRTGSGEPLRVLSVATALAIGGFLLVRPDWFHFQNGLDPFFYVGESLNLSDVIDQGGAAHYFISRWTLYVPELLLTRLLGATGGYLIMRLSLLAVVTASIVALDRDRTRRIDVAVVAFVVAFSPLVLRAVFVDYSDAIVVPIGVACVVASVQAVVRPRSAALLGAAGAVVLIANPFGVFMITITLSAYLWRARNARALLPSFMMMGTAALTVACAGLVFFRAKYGIDNVYAPTLDFIRQNASVPDPLRSPRLLWLQYRLWIYLPLLVLLGAWGLQRVALVRWHRRDLLVFWICAAQYAFQIGYQFGRDGTTLEIHYYFAYMIPAYSVAFAVLVLSVLRRCSRASVLAVGAGFVLVLALISSLPTQRFGNWLVFASAVAVVSLVVWGLGRRHPWVVPLAVVVLAFGAQHRSPASEPSVPGELRVDAGYDSVYERGESTGEAIFVEAASFVDRMNQLDNDIVRSTAFVVVGGHAHQLAATYSVHVAAPSHWINPPVVGPPGSFGLSELALARIQEEGYTYVAILCAPEQLAPVQARLADLGIDLDPPVLTYQSRADGATTEVFVAPIR